jgi:hypothetical protein
MRKELAPTEAFDDAEFQKVVGRRLFDISETYGVGFPRDEAIRFVGNLAYEVSRGVDLPRDPIEAVTIVLNRRLDALKQHAEYLIDRAKIDLEFGKTLLAEADIDPHRFRLDYFGEHLTREERERLSSSFFPYKKGGSLQDQRRSLANLLSLAKVSFAGMLPPQRTGRVAKFFARRYLELGGAKYIERLLYPTAATAAAVLALYLVETGANPPVGREIHRDCIDNSQHAGYEEITGFKATAGGKPIIMHFTPDAKVLKSIRWLEAQSAHLALVAGNHKECLFLMRDGYGTKMISADWFTEWFKSFSRSIESLRDLVITPNMLRPSVLLRAALERDGRLELGMAIGQHGEAVTQGYQQRYPVRLKYDQHMRGFHKAFETLVVSSLKEAAKLLRISEAEFDGRLEALRETGRGVFCTNVLGRPGNNGRKCEQLDCWNCPQMLIVLETDAIATLQLWQESLRSVQGEWERDRPERWEAIWLPWLCLADVVEEKMGRSLIGIWNAAKLRAAEIKASPNFVPHLAW